MNPLTPRARAAALSLACILALTATAPDARGQSLDGIFEPPPVVGPDEVLVPSLIRSPHHRIADEVRELGNSLAFEMESSFGAFRLESIALVAARVGEISTLAQAIDDYQRSNEQLALELRGILQVGADNWTDILTSPLQTVGSMANQAAGNVGQTFTELGEVVEGTVPNPAIGAGVDVYSSVIPADPVLASHKRNVASQLKLDLYSTNPRVQQFLNTLARARSGGNRTAGIIAVSLPRPAVRQVAGGRLENDARMAITRMTPPELYRHNEQRLLSLGVEEELVAAFLTHPRLSPTHKTTIVEHLVFLGRPGGAGAALVAATDTANEVEALAHVQTLRMLGLYHENERPLRRLVSGGHVLLAVTADDGLVVVLPFDVLFWDRPTEEIFTAVGSFADVAGFGERTVLVDGMTTPRAREEFVRLGFDLRARYPYVVE